MGLTATCNEGDIIVRYNGKILQKHFLENWFAIKEAELLSDGADYVESYTHRVKGDVSSEISEWPPTLAIELAALARQTVRSKPIEGRKAPSIDDLFRTLICKAFNVETQVDARFIHHVCFGWRGYVNTTFAQLGVDLTTARTFLRQQEGYKLLETRCKDLKTANFPITNIVVLGNGSLNMPHSRRAAEYIRPEYDGLCIGPLAQLAAIMEIRTLLGGTSRRPGLRALGGGVKPLPCVFQDPVTSKFEQRFLQSLGHKVVDDPDAFGLINANTLVIFLHNPGMEEWIVQGAPAWPAAMVVWESGPAWPDPEGDLHRGREQIEIQVQLFERAYRILPFMENEVIHPEGSESRYRPNKFNFHLRKDLDGAADFSFTV